MGKIEADIMAKRKKLNDESLRGLIIIDGHPTRRNISMWKYFSSINIDVICMPSHSSNVLQPLDQVVNGLFKFYLQKTSFEKNLIQKDTNYFIQLVYDSIYKSLSPSSIRKGFEKSFILPPSNVSLSNCICSFLNTLPQSSEFEKNNNSNFFTISGEVLTSSQFLQKWENYEEKKNKEKLLKKKKGKRKKEKKENNNDKDIIKEKIENWIDENIIIKIEKENNFENEEELEMYSSFDDKIKRKRYFSKREEYEYSEFFSDIEESNSMKHQDIDWSEFRTFNNKKKKTD
jgi:hypothetical protein